MCISFGILIEVKNCQGAMVKGYHGKGNKELNGNNGTGRIKLVWGRVRGQDQESHTGEKIRVKIFHKVHIETQIQRKIFKMSQNYLIRTTMLLIDIRGQQIKCPVRGIGWFLFRLLANEIWLSPMLLVFLQNWTIRPCCWGHHILWS